MYLEEACAALRSGNCLELRYDGYNRIVEVHAVGISTTGKYIMRVWQVEGGSSSGERSGWKLMTLNEAHSAHITNKTSQAPRPHYKLNDSAMSSIKCQVDI